MARFTLSISLKTPRRVLQLAESHRPSPSSSGVCKGNGSGAIGVGAYALLGGNVGWEPGILAFGLEQKAVRVWRPYL